MRDNLTLVCLRTLTKRGVVDVAKQREIVDRFIESLGIKLRSPDQPIRELSGGNQQKVLLARCMALNPKVLIVDEPTRGIDVGAKAEVHQLLCEMAGRGTAVIVISSELPELMALCDRIVVFREGRVTGVVSAADANEAALMDLMAVGHSITPQAASL